MHARERRGLSTLIDNVLLLVRTNRSIYNQLLHVDVQLRHCGEAWNVCPLSCLPALMFDLTSQLSETRPTRYASTKVGLHRHNICAYHPSSTRFAFPRRCTDSTVTDRRKVLEHLGGATHRRCVSLPHGTKHIQYSYPARQ